MKRGVGKYFIILVIDVFIVNVSFIAAYWLRFYQEVGARLGGVHPIAPFAEYAKALLFISYVWILTFHLLGLYRFDRNYDFIDIIYRVFKAVTFGTIVVLSLTFFYRPGAGFNYSRLVVFYSWFLNISLALAFRYCLRRVTERLHKKGYDTVKVLIVGTSEMARFVAKKIMSNPELGYRLVGYLDGLEKGQELVEGLTKLGNLEDLPSLVQAKRFEEILLAQPELGHYRLLELVSFCEQNGIKLTMIPSVYDLLIDYADVYELEGIPMVTLQEKPMNYISLVVKRIFDVFVSFGLLIITSPAWIVIAQAIKRDSPGPVFFKQVRGGRDGKPFKMVKFRTMVYNAEELRSELMAYTNCEEPLFKMQDDPRITRIGRFLRRSSLDELPQLLNVLKGDMSFIGPRPEELCFVQKYDIWQRRRLKVKPGITGLQQVMCRGTLSLTERVKYDIFYIRKRSLLMDLWILLKTVPVVFSGRGAS